MLTPEEELELQQLEAEQEDLTSQFNSIKQQLLPKPKVETGMLEAGARGIAKGLTFNTADELTALAESTVTGKPYEQALSESRAEYEAAEKEYPGTTLAGEITGGIAQGIGLGAVTGGAGAVGALGKVGQLAKSALLPTAGKSAVANIGSAALSGATFAGLSEIGESKKEGLGRLEEVPMAVATGAITGGALGAGVEGVKKVGSAITKGINKLIDDGNVPFSVEKIRDLYRAGKEGQGFITKKSGEQIDQKIEKASRDTVNLIQNHLDDARNLKKEILNTIDQPIKVNQTYDVLQNNLKELAKENLSDSKVALKRVVGVFENSGMDEAGNLQAITANDVINKLDQYLIDNPELSTEVKSVLKNSIDELKLNLRLSVKQEDILNAFKQNPLLQSNYEKVIGKLDDKALETSEVLTPYEQKFFKLSKEGTPELKQKRKPEKLELEEDVSKELNKKQKGRPKKPFEETPVKSKEEAEDIQFAIAEAKKLLKQKSMANPLGRLDVMMHNILNASETLGGVTRGDGSELKRTLKIFDVIRQSSAETGSGKKALMKYNEAIDQMKTADPKLAKSFEKVTKPAIKLMETEKFIRGSRLGEGPKDVSALSQFVTAPAIGTGLVGNVLAQVGESKIAKTVARPTLAYLQSKKQKIDGALFVEPDNKLLKMISKGLDNAIQTKDESKRAAILNTLMQYESVRKLFKEEE